MILGTRVGFLVLDPLVDLGTGRLPAIKKKNHFAGKVHGQPGQREA